MTDQTCPKQKGTAGRGREKKKSRQFATSVTTIYDILRRFATFYDNFRLFVPIRHKLRHKIRHKIHRKIRYDNLRQFMTFSVPCPSSRPFWFSPDQTRPTLHPHTGTSTSQTHPNLDPLAGDGGPLELLKPGCANFGWVWSSLTPLPGWGGSPYQSGNQPGH